MVLRIYNTLSKEKEEFVPLNDKKVGMYVCGITPYDYCHMGHARAYVAFDVIFRYLLYKGYDVTYVQNFTNVDDKIIAKAKKLGKKPMEAMHVAEKYIKAYFEDMDALGVKRAHIYPKVTEHIPDIIRLIERIMKNGYAYVVDGNVYFSVDKFKEYGKLSKMPRKQILAGARIEVDKNKRNPADFALWKKAKEGEPAWDSPWGKGRPGWHIECSTMSMKYLGETFDIHGGGSDLIFPHHENEIAQSEAATGKRFVKYWIHNGFITVDQEKMSKSLGNFFTIRDVMQRYPPQVIRYFLISAHYRSPIDFSDRMLENASRSLEKLTIALQNIRDSIKKAEDGPMNESEKEIERGILADRDSFIEAMDDDFNTPHALSALHEMARKANRYIGEGGRNKKLLSFILRTMEELGGVLNIFFEREEEEEIVDNLIQLLIDVRNEARRKKDYEMADGIRSKLRELGIILEDQKDGSTRWRKGKHQSMGRKG